ncbi:FadR/GntR family transcriptional regulator [Pseudonocardia pini]|uniref:FadR/GntR family transcriptional regulator n=1 Tax=Pseudonocardia pini TaxID=2758030 RepID=UPI0015F012A1|nr:FadR/GntR family transcriptional regulator [Pseudonocardia pini]
MDHEADLDPRYALSLDVGQALPDAIAETLRRLIEAGDPKPGDRLPTESELARKMKVARSSVRTALQKLEAQGAVEVRRGLGWFVRRQAAAASGSGHLFDPSGYRASELFELRIGLEGLAVSLAVQRATDGEIEDIAKANTEHQNAQDDPAELLRTDRDFHDRIVEASRNQLLIDTYQKLIIELDDWRYNSYGVPGVPIRSAREHAKVVRFLRSRDSGGARSAMNAHLQRLYDELADIREEPLDSTVTPGETEPDWHPIT